MDKHKAKLDRSSVSTNKWQETKETRRHRKCSNKKAIKSKVESVQFYLLDEKWIFIVNWEQGVGTILTVQFDVLIFSNISAPHSIVDNKAHGVLLLMWYISLVIFNGALVSAHCALSFERLGFNDKVTANTKAIGSTWLFVPFNNIQVH